MKPKLRQRPWARIVVGLVCVLSLTLLAACGSQVMILAQGGAFRPSGAYHMQRHVEQDLAGTTHKMWRIVSTIYPFQWKILR